ncbi:sigma-54-dependent transcriptional regulator [Thauera linaloolentis]|uniref:Two component sigma-54 specific Fis family transcriptional regulator n=1 Tax=Thauera linaloolentis (strain DSM 12138 / JCM 21573 / CCUG 41526 / CIP 105981 / IAM 15112 / NBRC 102519 / 47Lol) TaxID=1123367 RepID=N6Y8I5_THAL4|nr:sigma-54 dependent transcriptional regulator [Thauera linaloolentis]ENO90611.1 two component sigma-54 specific Fis family transcriptional regulator [Thauera linaloolentis 47Lol = DSM 12138]MCM8566117.1 sigma-54 dependent transcriptional regulator [Thauera linaloolentis]
MTLQERRNRPESVDVLVVDDEDDIRELLELSLLRMGLGCDTAGSVAEARACLESQRYRLCLTDMRLPDGDGFELVEYIQKHLPGLPVAVITAFGSIDTAIRALKLGAFDFVTKPIELKVLRGLVSHALKLEPRSVAAAPGGRRLIGDSPAFQQLRAQAEKLARNQAPVFIHGESGTGKEVIARLIHALGARGSGPFVPINCGAISPELMESEFFGHRKGSFTGAASDKEGLFQAANGGTLFLDEIGELPLAMQVKLLRAIQERAVRPVGAHAEEALDVRILSASHQDLSRLVAEGRFRQDLFFRINVITLRVPPLRERYEDIPALAEHILVRLAEREGAAPRRLAPAALAVLQRHAFPGNVRELENLLERACALCEGCEIGAEDIDLQPVEFALPAAHAPGGASAPSEPAADEYDPETDNELERLRVLKALEQTRWNRSAAARNLGMTLRQLRYRLQKWGME